MVTYKDLKPGEQFRRTGTELVLEKVNNVLAKVPGKPLFRAINPAETVERLESKFNDPSDGIVITKSAK